MTGKLDAKPLLPAPPESLEARLHALGQPYLFINLRAADANPGHPMHQMQSLRVITPNNEMISDITKVFDGILYIDRATPATPDRAEGDQAH